MTQYGAVTGTDQMTFLTALDRFFERLFDTLPLHRAMGVSAVLCGAMNIIDTESGVANILLNAYGLPHVLVVAYMALVAFSGVVMLVRSKPRPVWFVPLLSYFSINPIAYLTGAVFGENSLAFGFKVLGSVGLLWWLLIHTLRRGGDV